MEKKFNELIEKLKTDNKKLRKLKVMAVELGAYALAASLREMELTYFPEMKEATEAENKAQKLTLIFRMVQLNIPEDVTWLIDATLFRYRKRKGNFDLRDAAELMEKKREYFRCD